MDQLLLENEQIERDEKQIRQYMDETLALRHKIDELTNKLVVSTWIIIFSVSVTVTCLNVFIM